MLRTCGVEVWFSSDDCEPVEMQVGLCSGLSTRGVLVLPGCPSRGGLEERQWCWCKSILQSI